jgi:hypothetical protein
MKKVENMKYGKNQIHFCSNYPWNILFSFAKPIDKCIFLVLKIFFYKNQFIIFVIFI